MVPPLEEQIKAEARRIGFELVGIARATTADSFARLQAWLDKGYAGEMAYMHRHAEARRHPDSILPDVRSVVMLGTCYAPEAQPAASTQVARYARGQDYHAVLRRRLNSLLEWVQQHVGGCRGRGVVDTAPLLERDLARRAGLGWFGKNTMLLNKRLGSYFFLGALLLDLELEPDPPHEAQHCGTCTACLDACPTAAFAGPGQLDARRCISYLTIELRGPIPEELRPGVGTWLFGCDVCQDVCPWNRRASPTREPAFESKSDLTSLEPAELLRLSESEFRQRFAGTALLRSKRSGILRNAAIVLALISTPILDLTLSARHWLISRLFHCLALDSVSHFL